MIVGGNTRHEAYKILDAKEISAIVIKGKLAEKVAMRIARAFNATHGEGTTVEDRIAYAVKEVQENHMPVKSAASWFRVRVEDIG